MQAAEKHDGRSEPLAALVVVARGLVEQARAVEAVIQRDERGAVRSEHGDRQTAHAPDH